MNNGKRVRPSTMIAIRDGEREEELVGLKERIEEQHKLRDTELETEEADVLKIPAKVCTPSPAEYNRHCAIHLPCRNWCPICKPSTVPPSSRPSSFCSTHKHNASG